MTKSAVLMKKMKLYFVGSRQAYESAMSALSTSTTLDYINCALTRVAALDDAPKSEKEIAWLDCVDDNHGPTLYAI